MSPPVREQLFAIICFSASSSSLLLINKLCMAHVRAPSLLATLQFGMCTAFALGLKWSGAVNVDDWEWTKLKPYLLYTAMFVASIYCNMQSLAHANVETLIVFRACCPLLVALLEWAFMRRALPSARSFLALLLLVGGAASYVVSDKAFKVSGLSAYGWVTAYFWIISVEMVYGKHIVGKHLGFKTLWGPTLYTNAVALLPMLGIGLLTGEVDALYTGADWSPGAVVLMALSCVVGVSISFTGWYCRSLVTATCYTVLGVANKMLTVLVNVIIWDQHASAAGVISLLVCLLGASLYQQAPLVDELEDETADGVALRHKGGAPGSARESRLRPALYFGAGVLSCAACVQLFPQVLHTPHSMEGGLFSSGAGGHFGLNSPSRPPADALARVLGRIQRPPARCNWSDTSHFEVWVPRPSGSADAPPGSAQRLGRSRTVSRTGPLSNAAPMVPFARQLQSYARAFSRALSLGHAFLGAFHPAAEGCERPPLELGCLLSGPLVVDGPALLEPPPLDLSACPSRTALPLASVARGATFAAATAGGAQEIGPFSLRFAKAEAQLEKASRGWIVSQLMALLMRPTPIFETHLQNVTEALAQPADTKRTTGAAQPRARAIAERTLGVHFEAALMQTRHENATAHLIGRIIHLVEYAAPTCVLLAPTANSEATRVTEPRHLQSACKRLMVKLESQIERLGLAQSTEIQCVPVNHAGNLAGQTHSRAWDPSTHALTVMHLLSRCGLFLGALHTDFGLTVRELMRARLDATSSRLDVKLPNVFSIHSPPTSQYFSKAARGAKPNVFKSRAGRGTVGAIEGKR